MNSAFQCSNAQTSHRPPVRRLLVQPVLPQRDLHQGHQGPRREVQLHLLPGDLPDLPPAARVLPHAAGPVPGRVGRGLRPVGRRLRGRARGQPVLQHLPHHRDLPAPLLRPRHHKLGRLQAAGPRGLLQPHRRPGRHQRPRRHRLGPVHRHQRLRRPGRPVARPGSGRHAAERY